MSPAGLCARASESQVAARAAARAVRPAWRAASCVKSCDPFFARVDTTMSSTSSHSNFEANSRAGRRFLTSSLHSWKWQPLVHKSLVSSADTAALATLSRPPAVASRLLRSAGCCPDFSAGKF